MITFSYSKYATYLKCPRKFKFSYVDKVPIDRQESPAMLRGTKLHKNVEDLINGEIRELCNELRAWDPYFAEVRDQGAHPEREFGITKDWELCAFDAPDARVRGYLDVHCPALDEIHTVLELKTGNIYKEHRLQRDLYALAADILQPGSEQIDVITVYLDKHKMEKATYYQEDLESQRVLWASNFRKVESDKIFPPNPNYTCRWCDYSKQNGGPCQF